MIPGKSRSPFFSSARARVSGLTIAELLIAFVLVLLLLLYTISSFLASNNYLKRGKEYSTSLFLCQTKMEELQVTPITDIEAETGDFAPDFPDYGYEITRVPWEGELEQLEVRVTSPKGAIAKIRTLRQSQAYQGIIADPATNTVAFTKPNSATIHFWDDTNPSQATTASNPLTGGNPGALAGHPGHNLLWAVNQTTNTITPYRESEPQPWGAAISFPTVEGLGPTRLAGIAMDRMGNHVFCADWSNRGVWIYNDGVPGLSVGFQGTQAPRPGRPAQPRPHAPVSPPLGIPSGIATDPTGSLVIVADTENQCLRKLFVNLAQPSLRPPGYDPDKLESAPGVGYWLKERLRYDEGMGAPQGVAMNASGWVIYTIDRAYLYTLVENSPDDARWTREQLPDELTLSSPSGIVLDEINNVLFVTTKNGELWKHFFDPAAPEPWKKLVGGPSA